MTGESHGRQILSLKVETYRLIQVPHQLIKRFTLCDDGNLKTFCEITSLIRLNNSVDHLTEGQPGWFLLCFCHAITPSENFTPRMLQALLHSNKEFTKSWGLKGSRSPAFSPTPT